MRIHVLLWLTVTLLCFGGGSTGLAQERALLDAPSDAMIPVKPGADHGGSRPDAAPENSPPSIPPTGDAAAIVPPPAEKTATETISDKGIGNPLFAALPRDIQDAILKETETYHKQCVSTPIYNRYHDCACLAARFFEERLERGPDEDYVNIFDSIKLECVDKASIAGYAYDQCMLRFVYTPISNLGQHCVCYANNYAEMYEDAPGTNINYHKNLGLLAINACDIGRDIEYFPASR